MDLNDKELEIYSTTHLPKKGWLHGCLNCKSITSKIINKNINNQKVKIYLCNECKEKKKYETKFFKERLELKIELKKKLLELSNDSKSESDSDLSENDELLSINKIKEYLFPSN